MNAATFEKNLASRGLSLSDLRKFLALAGYGNCQTMVIGSAATASFDKESDVDVLALAEQGSVGHDIRILNGTVIDVRFMSRRSLLDELGFECSRGWDGLARNILEGVVIDGDWGSMQRHTESLFKTSPSVSLDRLRCTILNLLSDLGRRDTGILCRVWHCNALVTAIGDMSILTTNSWSRYGRELAPRLSVLLPDAYSELETAAIEYIISGDGSQFFDYVQVRLGIAPREYIESKFVI